MRAINQPSRLTTVKVAVAISLALSIHSCGNTATPTEGRLGGSTPTAFTISKVAPIGARPDTEVTLTGTGFKSLAPLRTKMILADGSEIEFPVKIASATSASFKMPSGAGLGLKTATVVSGGKDIGSFSLVANQESNTLPIYTGSASDVCNTITYIDKNGDQQTGAKVCTTPSSGSTTNPWDIRAGVTVSGVVGKMKTNCRNGINAAYIDEARAVSFNQPTSTNTTFTGTNTFSIGDRVRLSTPTGLGIAGGFSTTLAYYVTAGSTTTGVNLAMTAGGSAIAATSTVAGTIHMSKQSDGSKDIWDTVDDQNNNVGVPPTEIPGALATWTTSNLCGGASADPADDNIWLDVTTAGTGGAACAANPGGSPENCSFRDKITGLEFSKPSAYISTYQAIIYCDDLVHNGKSDWRLPTQKELQVAYAHAIHSINNVNFAGTSLYYLTSTSSGTSTSWVVHMANGLSNSILKSNSSYKAICVRP